MQGTSKLIAAALAIVVITFGATGAFVITADQARDVHVYPTTQHDARCIGAVIDQVMTAEPEYPQDIVPQAAAWCGLTVVVSHDSNGAINVRPTGPALAGLTPLDK